VIFALPRLCGFFLDRMTQQIGNSHFIFTISCYHLLTRPLPRSRSTTSSRPVSTAAGSRRSTQEQCIYRTGRERRRRCCDHERYLKAIPAARSAPRLARCGPQHRSKLAKRTGAPSLSDRLSAYDARNDTEHALSRGFRALLERARFDTEPIRVDTVFSPHWILLLKCTIGLVIRLARLQDSKVDEKESGLDEYLQTTTPITSTARLLPATLAPRRPAEAGCLRQQDMQPVGHHALYLTNGTRVNADQRAYRGTTFIGQMTVKSSHPSVSQR
jgi:hypothetical protein